MHSSLWPKNKTSVTVLQIHQVGVLSANAIENASVSEVVPVCIGVLVILLSWNDARISECSSQQKNIHNKPYHNTCDQRTIILTLIEKRLTGN
jgi:hypothetical protein